MDKLSEIMVSTRMWSLTIGGWAPVQNLIFTLRGLSKDQREPISFSPLIYNGIPYVAGLEGMRKDNLVQAIKCNVVRWLDRNAKAIQRVGENISYIAKTLSRDT